MPAPTALGLVAAVNVPIIAYEFFRHRESRARIRTRPGGFTREEAAGVEPRAGGAAVAWV